MVKIFIAYSPEDNTCSLEIQKGLAILKRRKQIEFFDQQTSPRGERLQSLTSALESADIALLILSNNFIASEECYEMETQALALAKSQDLKLIPILYNDCEWTESDLSKYQPLPRNQKFISNWQNQDVAFTEISREISTLIKSQSARSTSTAKTRIKLDANFAEMKLEISNNRLRNVLDQLIELTASLPKENNDLIGLKAQYTKLKSEIDGYRIDSESATVRENQIRIRVLSKISELERNYA